jgi:hypothetical protein
MIDNTTGPDHPATSATIAEPAADEPAPHATPAQQRFQTCRWRKPAGAGIAEHCTHRDVLPMAGTSGFNPESWCPDCAFYKLRRVPRRDY